MTCVAGMLLRSGVGKEPSRGTGGSDAAGSGRGGWRPGELTSGTKSGN